MSDPRAVNAYDGIDAARATFTADGSTITYDATKTGGSAQVGLAVKLSGNGTVALTTDGSAVLGLLETVQDDLKCTVQFEGVMALPGGASATLTPGSKIVGALGASSAHGYIRSAVVPGGTYAQAEVDESGVARGCIWDASDTTAVYVDL